MIEAAGSSIFEQTSWVVVHPQSIIHSFVEFVDGSVIAWTADETPYPVAQPSERYDGRLGGLILVRHSNWN